MKLNLKKITLLSLLLGLVVLPILAADTAEWTTDFPMAQAKARVQKKMVLLDFTGSDWCPPCMALHKTVFSTPEFAAYAAKNLVLVLVDFPNNKPQSEELKKANQALQTRFKVEGYPTIIVLDGEGKKLGELGYMDGGPKPFIAALEKLKK